MAKTGLVDYFNSFVKQAEIAVVKSGKYTAVLRDHLANNGMPDDIVNQTKIDHDGDTPVIKINSSIEDKFHTLNRGVPGSPGNYAAHKFVLGIK